MGWDHKPIKRKKALGLVCLQNKQTNKPHGQVTALSLFAFAISFHLSSFRLQTNLMITCACVCGYVCNMQNPQPRAKNVCKTVKTVLPQITFLV